MTPSKLCEKHSPAVIKTHNGKHWKRYIKGPSWHVEGKKNATDATKQTHTHSLKNVRPCFSSVFSKTKKTQNIPAYTLRNDLTSGLGRNCFAFQVKYKACNHQ